MGGGHVTLSFYSRPEPGSRNTMLSGRDYRGDFANADTQIRHGFVRKVYGIVGTQLLLTAGVALAILHAGVGYLQSQQNLTLGLLLFSMVITIGTMYACGGALLFSFYIVYDTQLIL